MYADDTNVTFAARNMISLETQINAELKSINLWLKANKLSLNVAKTEFMVISSRQKLLSLFLNISLLCSQVLGGVEWRIVRKALSGP